MDWWADRDAYLDALEGARSRLSSLAVADTATDLLPPTEREIARYLHEAERAEIAQAERTGLLQLAHRHRESGEVPERVRAAMARALAQPTFSAVEALRRELERSADEEIAALMLLIETTPGVLRVQG